MRETKKDVSLRIDKIDSWVKYMFKISQIIPAREAVIVCSALIERLVFIILNNLLANIKNKEKDLERIPFRQQIKLLHFLKFIDNNHYNILNKMYDIRNKFAHFIEIDDFRNPEVNDMMINLKKNIIVKKWLQSYQFGSKRVTTLDEFKALIQYMVSFLFHRQDVEPIEIKFKPEHHLLEALRKSK